MIIDRELYSEFIKDEYKLEFVLSLEEEPRIVSQILSTLEKHLKFLVKKGEVETFSLKENRFEIDTQRYVIYILVLHSGDVYLYTMNKKTNYKANYDKRMGLDSEAVLNMVEKFI